MPMPKTLKCNWQNSGPLGLMTVLIHFSMIEAFHKWTALSLKRFFVIMHLLIDEIYACTGLKIAPSRTSVSVIIDSGLRRCLQG